MQKNYKLVPPEGGWGYMVCLGMALPFIQMIGALTCFALIFGEFFESLGEETSALTLVTSTYFCSLSVSGLFANSLFTKYTLRKVAIFAGFLYFLGSLYQVFVQSTLQLLIAFGIIQGFAAGLIFPAGYTNFNTYFVERRVTMMSLTQTLVGLGTMTYPVIIQRFYAWYGFRGCLLMIAALNGNAVVGMMMMHPVEWHMKRVPIEGKTEDVNGNGAVEKDQLEPLMEEKPSEWSNLQRAASVASLGPIMVNDASEMKSAKGGKFKSFIESLDLPLLKKPIYMNITLGASFALYSDVAFFTLQPAYLFYLKYSKADTAAIIAIGAAADLSSRIFLAFGSAICKVSPRYVYLAGAAFTCVARVGYGLFVFLHGILNFIIGPVIGYIRDKSQDYILTFHIINGIMAACAIPWLIEILYIKYLKKRKENEKIENP